MAIFQSNFVDNVAAGIFLSGSNLGNVHIQSSTIRDSTDVGLRVEFSRGVKNLTLLRCSLLRNKKGIYFNSFSGNTKIEQCNISNSTQIAFDVDSEGSKTVYIINSSITYCKSWGIYTRGRSYGPGNLRLLVIGTFFGMNEKKAFISESPVSLVSFINSSFVQNRGPVLHFDRFHHTTVRIEGNVVKDNAESSFLTLSSFYSDDIFIRNNQFLSNLFQENGVINVGGSLRAKKLTIAGNIFDRNTGRSINIEGTTSSSLYVKLNVFRDNNCSRQGVIEVRRMEKEVIIVDNVFMNNTGMFMVLLQSVYVIEPRTIKQNFTFDGNSLVNNTGTTSFDHTCEVNISGFLENKTVSMHGNRFNSDSFPKEVCLNIHAYSYKSTLNLSMNFWGYDADAGVRKRIFDGRSNHELVSAIFYPFISTRGDLVLNKSQAAGNLVLGNNLGGRISSHVQLKRNHSPYTVDSDITVLPEASLTVEPGVELQFGPSVSMLILGSLYVAGTADHPVRFSLFKKSQKQNSLPVRLIAGKYPWIGRLEVNYSGSWAPVCFNKTRLWALNNARVVCKQLGYESPLVDRQIILGDASLSNTNYWPFMLHCFGNEKEVGECPRSLDSRRCNVSRYVSLNCRGGAPWGNVRFVREVGSTMQPSSVIKYLQIEHCGKRHGIDVPAIEAIQYVPKLNSVSVSNCTSGGLKVLFPENETVVEKSSFLNTGGNGTEIISTGQNVSLIGVTSIKNKHGVSFKDFDEMTEQGISYGQIMLCARGSAINLTQDEVFIYFKMPLVDKSDPTISCQKVIQVEENYALSFKILVQQKYKLIRLYDPFGREMVFSHYNSYYGQHLKEEMIFPWNRASVLLTGHFRGDVLIQVKRIKMKG